MRKSKKERKLDESISDATSKCRYCGHTMQMLVTTDKMICSWCNHTVRNSSKSRFRYIMLKKIREERENQTC